MPRGSLQVACVVLGVAIFTTSLRAQESKLAPAPHSSSVLVDHGRYIVEGVALCGQCHSPIDVDGHRDRLRWLMGGQVALESTLSQPTAWAIVAPRLAGSPAGTDEEFITLLTTGVSRRGHPLRQPMPQFRMTRADAEAVLAYLKSLGKPGRGPDVAVATLTRR